MNARYILKYILNFKNKIKQFNTSIQLSLIRSTYITK